MSELDSNLVQTKEDTSTGIIENSLQIYGASVIKSKFPTEVDGCKDVIRNIIWALKDRTSQTKFLRVVGDTMVIHPSGDKSIIDAMYRIGRSYAVGHRLLDIGGCEGKYYDPSTAAHPRYLDVMLSDFARDLFFNGVHIKTIPQKYSSDFGEIIAKHFIPRLPVPLMMGNLTVGFAFKSEAPMVDLHDVCDLVMVYSDFYKKGGVGIPPYKTIAKYLVPGYPIPGIIKNKQAIIDAYSKGDFSVSIISEGTCSLTGTNLTLFSLPYGVDFGRITAKFRDTLIGRKSDVKDIVTSANQYSSEEAEFSIEFKKGYNPFYVNDLLKKHLEYHNSVNFIYNYTREGKIIVTNPAFVVQRWYMARYLSIAGGLKYKQSRLIGDKIEVEAILLICEYMDEVIDLIRAADNPADAVVRLHARFKDKQLSWNQAEIIAGQPLTRLSKINSSELTAKLEKIKADMAATLAAFGKIHDTIYSDAAFFKKKYPSTKKTKYSEDYIGYVQFGNLGIINFFDDSEIPDILNSKGWASDITRTVHKYKSPPNRRHYILNKRMYPITDPSKYMRCDRIVELPSTKRAYTLCVSQGFASIVDREIHDTDKDYTLIPVNEEFYAIHRDGHIRKANVSEFVVRKNLSRGIKSKIVYGIPKSANDVVVLHMSEGEPNVIRADRVLKDGKIGTLKTAATGKLHIIGVYPIDVKEIIVNVPKECTKGFNITHLFIYDIKHLFNSTGYDNQIIMTSKATGWTNFNVKAKIVRSDVVKTMYTLDLSSTVPKGDKRHGKVK